MSVFKNNLIPKVLTYLGTLPIILCALLFLSGNKGYGVSYVFPAYSVLIISFLCGLHWAYFMLDKEKKIKTNLYILSNVIALTAWFTQVNGSMYAIQSLTYLISFFVILAIDYQLYKNKIIETWFWKLRFRATLIVSLSMLVILLS